MRTRRNFAVKYLTHPGSGFASRDFAIQINVSIVNTFIDYCDHDRRFALDEIPRLRRINLTFSISNIPNNFNNAANSGWLLESADNALAGSRSNSSTTCGESCRVTYVDSVTESMPCAVINCRCPIEISNADIKPLLTQKLLSAVRNIVQERFVMVLYAIHQHPVRSQRIPSRENQIRSKAALGCLDGRACTRCRRFLRYF